MGLLDIHSGGIEGYCSDLIMDEDAQIYFLSVGGYQTAVKGIIANVLEYGTVSLMKDNNYVSPQRSRLNYKVHYQRLPSGLFQGVVIPKIALPENKDPKDMFLIIAEDNQSAGDLFFKNLDHRIEIPLHPIWRYWLWDAFIEKDWLTPLKTLVGDLKGYLVEIDEDELKDIITMEINNRNPEIMRCFEKGETDGRDRLFEGFP